jgi:hypothetical protein
VCRRSGTEPPASLLTRGAPLSSPQTGEGEEKIQVHTLIYYRHYLSIKKCFSQYFSTGSGLSGLMFILITVLKCNSEITSDFVLAPDDLNHILFKKLTFKISICGTGHSGKSGSVNIGNFSVYI